MKGAQDRGNLLPHVRQQVAAVLITLIVTASIASAACPASIPCDIGIPGDFDGDGDVDNADFVEFKNCATRATVRQPDEDCRFADLDGDDDVDVVDFGEWQRMRTGPCDCGPYLKEPPRPAAAEPWSGAADLFGNTDPTHSYSSEPMDPVFLFSGEFHESYVDLRIKGRGLDFVWARTYRSRIGPNTTMGNGWDFSYNLRIKPAGIHIRVFDGNTRADVYALQPDGTWTRPDFYRVLSKNVDDTYTLTFADGGKWEFKPLDGSAAAGKIDRIVDRNDNALRFTYDAGGRLIKVLTTLDLQSDPRDVTIAYNSDGFIETVTDYTGRQVTYSYYQDNDADGSSGDLKSAATPQVSGTPNGNDFPAGKKTTYTYSKDFTDQRLNHNLLTITDAKGQTYLTNVYSSDPDTPPELRFDRVIRQIWGDPGDRIDAVYKVQTPAAGNHFATVKATVNDRVGNVREYAYDGLNRQVSRRDYTGRADPDQPTDLEANLNPPVNPLRPGDPAFFETRIAYNELGNESDYSYPARIDYPNGSATEFVYELRLNPAAPQRSRGNLREVHYHPGPQGGDQTNIDESYQYDPNSNFATRHVDGRGNVTLHTYDSRGNRIHTQHRISSIVEDYEYNTFGQMLAHVLPDNGSSHRRRDEYTYYSTGPQRGYCQSQIVDVPNLSLTTTYEYDPLGRLVRLIDPRGHDTLYTLNALDQVVRTTSREVTTGSGIRYQCDRAYDANDNLLHLDWQNLDEQGILQPNTHFTTSYEYEILNRPIRIRRELDPVSNIVTDYEYDDNRNRTMIRYGEATSGNQPTNVVSTQYDERDLAFRVVRAPGDAAQSTTQYDYDVNGNLTRAEQGTESVGRITTYTYDGYSRLTGTVDAMGNVLTYHYDAEGNRVSQRLDGEPNDVLGGAGNFRLSETLYQYDAMNRRISQAEQFFNTQTQAPIGDGQAVTTFEYTDNSQLKTLTDDNNADWQYAYDTANRRSVVTDPKANTTSYSYDANGNIISTTEVDQSDIGDPAGTLVTTYSYDNLDRLIRTVDNVNNIITWQYDSRGNRVVEIDARGNEMRYTYDGLSRLIQTVRDMDGNGAGGSDPNDIVTSRSWDQSSRVISQTDDNGNTTNFTYDALNRRTERRFADNQIASMTYDVHDNLLGLTDANASVINYTYDRRNRLTSKSITPATGVVGTTTESYAYDGLSRLISANDNDSSVTRQYDSLSNVTRETQQVVPSGPLRTVTLAYDGVGNLTRLTYPGGRVVVSTYDGLNRPLLMRDDPPVPGSTIATNLYRGPYLLERRNFGNGTRLDAQYDGVRRTMYTRHSFIVTDATLDDRTYGWDPNHNKLQMHAPSGNPPELRIYNYDAADRLMMSQNPPAALTINYGLDGVGNRMTVNGGPDAGTYTLDPTLPEPGDYQMNQYTSIALSPTASMDRTYDRNGNLKTSHNNQRRFSYDYVDQLAEFIDIPGGLTVMYKYDCFGRRIEKNSGGVLTRYYYAGSREIEEQNQSNITTATYVNGSGCGRGSQPLQMVRAGQKYYYHGDDVGSTVKITSAGGQVVEQYQYADYGKPSFFNGSGAPITASAIGNAWLFRGGRYESEPGFVFGDDDAGSRVVLRGYSRLHRLQRGRDQERNDNWDFGGSHYMDTSVGRFISRADHGRTDALGNAFTYNGNNPASPQSIPTEMPFRPPRITPKPIVKGPQTAVVVGPPDEEIYPDKYGRVKVQFHWDREGKSDIARLHQVGNDTRDLVITTDHNRFYNQLVGSPDEDRPPFGPTDDISSQKDDDESSDADDITREVPDDTKGRVASGKIALCGATGAEAIPFMLLWWRAFRRRQARAMAGGD